MQPRDFLMERVVREMLKARATRASAGPYKQPPVFWTVHAILGTNNIAKLCGVRTPNVARWKSGWRPIPDHHLKTLEEAQRVIEGL